MALSPVLIWFLVGLALILLEFMIPGVVLVFFGIGAWLVAVTTAIGLTASLWSQLLLFALSSLVLLLVLRRSVRTRFLGHMSDEQDPVLNIDQFGEFAGQHVRVLHDIVPNQDDGRVELKGAAWKARADEPLAAGQMVEVVRADGITLIVRAIERKEPS